MWCEFKDGNNDIILFGRIYRSTNSSYENTQKMYKLLTDEHLHDNELVECIRNATLIQMVSKPTRVRAGQASNILDLVMVNEENFI